MFNLALHRPGALASASIVVETDETGLEGGGRGSLFSEALEALATLGKRTEVALINLKMLSIFIHINRVSGMTQSTESAPVLQYFHLRATGLN